MMNRPRPVGEYLREWRQRRRLSQLDFALDAGVSTRHLSFMENSRALPSREMVLRLAGHEPYPALAIDRHWNLVASNKAVPPLLAGVDASLQPPPVNVLRLSLHPLGIAPRIANYREWRAHLFDRLRHQIGISADPALAALLHELESYPAPHPPADNTQYNAQYNAQYNTQYGGVVVPFRLATPAGTLSFISTTTVFGTPLDVTLSELALESFFPADAQTADALRAIAQAQG